MPDAQETVGDLFRAGRLEAALQAAGAAVRKAPGDLGARMLLSELLLFAGNLERADVILDAAGTADPSAALVVAEFRQLLRADLARRGLLADGRVPEFLGEPTPALQAALAAFVALREGDPGAAARHAAEAERLRPRVAGQAGSTRFDDFRDADDLCAGFFEVLTTTGKYYWIPTERVQSMEFHQPRRARDLAWRRVSMSVADGPDGEVYLPAIYGTASGEAVPDPCRLGRATEWRDEGPGPVRGLGLRTFLAGEEARDIMSLDTLTFA